MATTKKPTAKKSTAAKSAAKKPAAKPAAKKSPAKSSTSKSSKAKSATAKSSTAKKPAARKKAGSKRELIEPHKGDKRFVRRKANGSFGKTVDVGKSLAADKRRTARKKVSKGQGDRGDTR